jgi:hypothetical protein
MDEMDVDRLSAELIELMNDYKFDKPNWAPLEKVMPLKWCPGFMWMAETGGIHLYKHGFTRHYLNLDEEGNAYRYLGPPSRYERMDLHEAIEWVFQGLEKMGETRESAYDDDAVRRKHEALTAAGWTTINVSPEGTRVTKPAGNGARSKTHFGRKDRRRKF